MTRRARLLAWFVLATSLVPMGRERIGASEDDGEPTRSSVDLTGARILASSDVPSMLRTFLPESRAPEPLRWPLPPDGPLLILGLPARDPLAGEIASALGAWDPGDDLAGGWRVAAWRDGERTIALVLAEDPAGWMAARFELEVTADADRLDPAMRTVDWQASDEHGATRIREGRRGERPRMAWRCWRGDVKTPRDASLRLAGARANRVLLAPPRAAALAEAFAAAGVEVVVEIASEGTDLAADRERVAVLAREHGVREALLRVTVASSETASLIAEISSWPLERIVLALPDAAARERALDAVVGRIAPEIVLLVPARSDDPVESRWIARARRAGVRWVLDETFGAPSLVPAASGDPTRIPLLPFAAPAPAADRADAAGVLVTGRLDHVEETLALAWGGTRPTNPTETLHARLPIGLARAADPRAAALARLEPTDGRPDPVWLVAMRERLTRPGATSYVTVPVVPVGARIDGALTDAAWAWATSVPGQAGVSVVSDGRRLLVGWRIEDDEPRELDLGTNGVRVTIDPRRGTIDVASNVRAALVASGVWCPPAAYAWRARAGAGGTAEIALDRFDLGLDAHRGQRIGPLGGETGGCVHLLVLR